MCFCSSLVQVSGPAKLQTANSHGQAMKSIHGFFAKSPNSIIKTENIETVCTVFKILIVKKLLPFSQIDLYT